MFSEFFSQGSIVAVILMVYAGNVMMEALRMDHLDPNGLHIPATLKHPISAIFMFASIPCAIWPAVYIGLYSGWVAGIVSWFVLQGIGALGTVLLGIRGPLIALHFVAACIAFPTGYYLSVSSLLA